MPELIPPDARVRESFIVAMEEFRAEGRGDPVDRSMIGQEIRAHGVTWSTPEGFRQFIAALRAQALEETPRPEGFVPSTTLWWVDGADYLGRIAIRHRLSPVLLEFGGHIGYDVRPSARRRGHATAMLRAALPIAFGFGIEQALITCDDTNVASRKVIESAGGVLEDQRDDKLRFWAPTRVSPIVDVVAWGEIRVGGFGVFKDAKLFPGGAREWDWSETGTRHSPGIQPADVDELVERGAEVVVLSRGMDERLEVMPKTLHHLERSGVEAHVAESRAAVELYNELAQTRPAGALIHSTC